MRRVARGFRRALMNSEINYTQIDILLQTDRISAHFLCFSVLNHILSVTFENPKMFLILSNSVVDEVAVGTRGPFLEVSDNYRARFVFHSR